MISKETISKVNEAINIVEIIGDYIKLKKRGANYIGLSPFSNERTPSFTVSPVKNIFKCFSSGKGGNAISFLMEHESLTYPEAIRLVSEKYKIEVIDDEVSEGDKENLVLSESLFLCNKAATDFYLDALIRSDSTLQYLSDRGINQDSITKWQIGYANSNHYNSEQFLIKDYSLLKENIIKADLAFLNARNELYDKYIDRVIFPFHNLSGRITGFSGRTLKDDKNIPKYTNTKENEIFHKGLIIYGIFFARKAIVKANVCNIVEGQLDVISMHQHGFENTVGTSGTAITKEHLLILKRFCSRICFIYDGDDAGQKAIGRGIEIAIELGLYVDVLIMPDKEDPDSFLLKYGAEAFFEYSKVHTGDIIDFYMKDGKSISEEEKQVNGRILLRLIALIGNYDIFRRSPKVDKLSRLFNVDKRKLNEAIDRIQVNPLTNPDITSLSKVAGSDLHELELIKVLILYGHLPYLNIKMVYYYILENTNPDYFKNNVALIILNDYWGKIKNEVIPSIDDYTQFSDKAVAEFATNIAFDEFELSKSWDGLVDIKPDYKEKVKSALNMFLISYVNFQIENNEGLITSCIDQEQKEILLNENSDLKNVFRSLSKKVGINYFK